MMKGLGKFESCYKPTKCANVTNADLTTSWDGLNNPHLMYVMMMARKLETNYLKESVEEREKSRGFMLNETHLLFPSVRVVEVVGIWLAGMVYSSHSGEYSHLVVASWKWVENVQCMHKKTNEKVIYFQFR